MSHVRLISIPESWSLKYFLKGIYKALNWRDRHQEGIKMIHVESLKNGRCHVRLTFNQHRMLQELMRAGKETRDRNLKSLSINGTTILFEVMDNLKEKFKMTPTKRNPKSNTKSTTVMVSLFWNDTLFDLMDKIYCCKINQIVYISMNSSNSFVKFINQHDCDRFIKSMTESNYRVKYSYTSLNLHKYNHAITEGRNLEHVKPKVAKLHNKNNPRQLVTKSKAPESDKKDVTDELSQKINEITEKVNQVVTTQNNFMPPINVLGPAINYPYSYNLSAYNPNLSAFNNNMNLLASQYPDRIVNVPMIEGIVRIRNSMYNNSFF
jgi:hypothetical protein